MDKPTRIVKAVGKLPMSDRKEIARRIIEQIDRDATWINAEQRCARLIPIAAEAIGCEYNPNTRRACDTLVRSFVARRMVNDGYSHTAIGKAMGRDHSTVTGMIRSMEALLDGYYGLEAIRQYKLFIALDNDRRTIQCTCEV